MRLIVPPARTGVCGLGTSVVICELFNHAGVTHVLWRIPRTLISKLESVQVGGTAWQLLQAAGCLPGCVLLHLAAAQGMLLCGGCQVHAMVCLALPSSFDCMHCCSAASKDCMHCCSAANVGHAWSHRGQVVVSQGLWCEADRLAVNATKLHNCDQACCQHHNTIVPSALSCSVALPARQSQAVHCRYSMPLLL